MLKRKKYNSILITGIAGFIGFHLANFLAKQNPKIKIIGIDNLNDYYSVELKQDRLKILNKNKNITFFQADITDFEFLKNIAASNSNIDLVIHLAAQAGIKSSIDQPFKYVTSNLVGQVCMLEFIKLLPNLKKFIYASSSSVYRAFEDDQTPFKEGIAIQRPLSLYAATKQTAELMGDVYSRLFNIPMVGIRFFTAYGPYGRPDMAIYKIAHLIANDKIVEIASNGKVSRDFTYIDDIIDGILAVMDHEITPDQNGFQNQIFNLGTGRNTNIVDIVNIIANNLAKEAEIKYCDVNLFEMQYSLADISKAKQLLDYKPKTDIEVGIKNFIKWYQIYHKK
jgi:UDP-glucuronate 4-epimerase